MLTYKKSGVDVDRANIFVNWIKKNVPSIGFFSGFYEINKNQVIVGTTDGVGTKLKIAQLVGRHDTIGIDLVAMNVNDIIVCGARPIFFLDYIAVGKLDLKVMKDIMRGIMYGCKVSGCNLMGGETAEMPGMYKNGEYDLAGFACGLVEKHNIIKGENVSVGDVLIGLKSSGLHSNGYSLVRKVFKIDEQKKYAKFLLVPTKIYVKIILNLLKSFRPNRDIKAMAHITGGGFYDNIVRILPNGMKAVVNKSLWVVPKIFQLIQKKGKICEKEMFRTFNMGVGMIVVVNKNCAKSVLRYLGNEGFVIGEIEKNNKPISEVVII